MVGKVSNKMAFYVNGLKVAVIGGVHLMQIDALAGYAPVVFRETLTL